MVRALLEAVQTAGIVPAAFLTRSQVESARVADPYAWFAVEEIDRLVATAVEMTNDPAFGLHWGERSPLMQFDLASPLTATAPTLRTAIRVAERFQALVLSHPGFAFIEQDARAYVRFKIVASSALGERVGTELSILGMMRLIRYYAGEVRRVDIAYPRPSYGSEYERVLGTVRFGQRETILEIDPSALDRAAPHRNAELHDALVERTEQLRHRVLGELSVSERVARDVRVALPRLPAMAEVARTLEMSERSLRRRLRDEGTSYSDVIDRVQRELSRELVASGNRPQKELAAALGFDSVSGLTRALKRWNE